MVYISNIPYAFLSNFHAIFSISVLILSDIIPAVSGLLVLILIHVLLWGGCGDMCVGCVCGGVWGCVCVCVGLCGGVFRPAKLPWLRELYHKDDIQFK